MIPGKTSAPTLHDTYRTGMTIDALRTWFGTRFLAIGSREQAARIVRRASYYFILTALVLLALQGLSIHDEWRADAPGCTGDGVDLELRGVLPVLLPPSRHRELGLCADARQRHRPAPLQEPDRGGAVRHLRPLRHGVVAVRACGRSGATRSSSAAASRCSSPPSHGSRPARSSPRRSCAASSPIRRPRDDALRSPG